MGQSSHDLGVTELRHRVVGLTPSMVAALMRSRWVLAAFAVLLATGCPVSSSRRHQPDAAGRASPAKARPSAEGAADLDTRPQEDEEASSGSHRLSLVRELSLTDLSAIVGHEGLRELDVSYSPVVDLGPIVDAPELAVVVADNTAISALPQVRIPQLRGLRVLSTDVDARQVKRFRKLNPQCTLVDTWEGALSVASKGTWMRIRPGGVRCGGERGAQASLAVVTDPAEVEAFVSLIETEESGALASCACCGGPTVEFYRGKSLEVSVGIHHGKRLVWREGDAHQSGPLAPLSMDGVAALLTSSSQAALTAWLSRFPAARKHWYFPDELRSAALAAADQDRPRSFPWTATVLVTFDGFHLRTSTGELPAACGTGELALAPVSPSPAAFPAVREGDLGPPAGAYPLETLRRCLAELGRRTPLPSHVAVLASFGLRYEVVVQTMGTVRSAFAGSPRPAVILGVEALGER